MVPRIKARLEPKTINLTGVAQRESGARGDTDGRFSNCRCAFFEKILKVCLLLRDIFKLLYGVVNMENSIFR
jgi:hypothetical protein